MPVRVTEDVAPPGSSTCRSSIALAGRAFRDTGGRAPDCHLPLKAGPALGLPHDHVSIRASVRSVWSFGVVSFVAVGCRQRKKDKKRHGSRNQPYERGLGKVIGDTQRRCYFQARLAHWS
jgi:hypothetical protein